MRVFCSFFFVLCFLRCLSLIVARSTHLECANSVSKLFLSFGSKFACLSIHVRYCWLFFFPFGVWASFNIMLSFDSIYLIQFRVVVVVVVACLPPGLCVFAHCACHFCLVAPLRPRCQAAKPWLHLYSYHSHGQCSPRRFFPIYRRSPSTAAAVSSIKMPFGEPTLEIVAMHTYIFNTDPTTTTECASARPSQTNDCEIATARATKYALGSMPGPAMGKNRRKIFATHTQQRC